MCKFCTNHILFAITEIPSLMLLSAVSRTPHLLEKVDKSEYVHEEIVDGKAEADASSGDDDASDEE
jgi:hypothetical protein